MPSDAPSVMPSDAPSAVPSDAPSDMPSDAPLPSSNLPGDNNNPDDVCDDSPCEGARFRLNVFANDKWVNFEEAQYLATNLNTNERLCSLASIQTKSEFKKIKRLTKKEITCFVGGKKIEIQEPVTNDPVGTSSEFWAFEDRKCWSDDQWMSKAFVHDYPKKNASKQRYLKMSFGPSWKDRGLEDGGGGKTPCYIQKCCNRPP